MKQSDYENMITRLEVLQDIENNDPRCDEFNELLDEVISYEDEHNIYVTRT